MTNPLKGEVQISLGEKTYKARLTIDALVRIEEATNLGILKLATKIASAECKLSELIIILTSALRGGGNDLQEKDIKEIISDIGIVQASTEVARLIASSLSDPNDEEAEEVKLEKAT